MPHTRLPVLVFISNTQKFRGTALGFYNWGIYLGYSLAFGFNFVLNAPHLHWRWVFLLASLPGFAVALLMLGTVREPPRISLDQVRHSLPPFLSSATIQILTHSSTSLYPSFFLPFTYIHIL